MVKYDKVDRQNRDEADAFFNKKMKDAEGYGQEAEMYRRRGQMAMANEAEERAQIAQKEMTDALSYKVKDNEKKGRTFQDGYEY